jgi:hypothetical protein
MENELDLDNPINVPEETNDAPLVDIKSTPEYKELEEKNKQLFERAKNAEGKVKDLKPLVETKEEPKHSSNDPRDIVRLAKALSGYSDEEVNFIYKNAKDVNLDSIIEATKDPWVKTAIDSTREKVAKENKIPESSLVPGGKSTKAITDEDMKNDPDAHKKAFEEFMKTGQSQEQGI